MCKNNEAPSRKEYTRSECDARVDHLIEAVGEWESWANENIKYWKERALIAEERLENVG